MLFAGELPLFRGRLPAAVQAEMAAWKEQEKAAKLEVVAKRKAAREAKAERAGDSAAPADEAATPPPAAKKRPRGAAGRA